MAFTFLSRSTLKGEKATLGTSFWSRFSPTGFARILLRFFQFVLGITVIGLYAGDVARARQAGAYVDSKWVWAVVCGALGAGAALVLMLPLVKAWFFFYVDAFLFLCYLVAFGIFGRIFIPVDVNVNEGKGKDNTGIRRMKHAVWVLLTNMLLWLVTAILGAVVFWKSRKARTSHTGRAALHV